jgi:hypothetical protein
LRRSCVSGDVCATQGFYTADRDSKRILALYYFPRLVIFFLNVRNLVLIVPVQPLKLSFAQIPSNLVGNTEYCRPSSLNMVEHDRYRSFLINFPFIGRIIEKQLHASRLWGVYFNIVYWSTYTQDFRYRN